MKGEVMGVLLSLAAGLSTCVGGAIVFCAVEFNPVLYSAAMALSAGVMAYVSFIEMFAHGLASIKVGMPGHSHTIHYLLATSMLFIGWGISWALDQVLSCAMEWHRHRKTSDPEEQPEDPFSEVELRNMLKDIMHEPNTPNTQNEQLDEVASETSDSENEIAYNKAPGASEPYRSFGKAEAPSKPKDCCKCPDNKFGRLMKRLVYGELKGETTEILEKIAHYRFMKDEQSIKRLGIFTAVVLGIHNFPEGIATWTATVLDPKLGAGMAVAIAVHNIPEGIAIGIPIYYATHSKTKAMLATFFSGMAEPLGALLSWAILGNSKLDLSLGLVFGVVAGIMLCVALRDLYPTALKYDPGNRVSTKWFLLGMIIMALSLVLFEMGW